MDSGRIGKGDGKRTGRCEGRDCHGGEKEEKSHGCGVFVIFGEVCW